MKQAMRTGWIGVACLGVAILAGCPAESAPPFDATGDYMGTWSWTETVKLDVQDCPLLLTLYQRTDLPVINFTVAGIADLRWDCLVPEVALAVLGVEAEYMQAPLLAIMDNDGRFTLNVQLDLNGIPQELLDLLDAEVLDEIPLQQLQLSFDGLGLDTDLDGFMDVFDGALTLQATYVDEGLQTVSGAGTFAITRILELP